MKNDFFIGDGYYFEINDCAWASQYAKADKVCAPNNGYTAYYNRRYNTLVSTNLYYTTRQCAGENNF